MLKKNYFQDDIVEAKQIKEKRRKVLPGVYNPARLNERPLPLLVLVPNNEQQQLGDQQLGGEQRRSDEQKPNSDDQSIEQDPFGSLSLNSSNSDISTVSNNEELTVANHERQFDETQENERVSLTETSANDEQQQIGTEELIAQNTFDQTSPNQNDSIEETATATATDALTNVSNASVSGASTSSNSPLIKPDPFFAPLVQENAQAIDDVFNSSFEKCDESGDVLIYPKDVIPMPLAEKNPYEVKQNDILSGNMAYATNVRFILQIY